MNLKIAQLSLLVKDYDEAIEFYTKKLKFQLLEDNPLTETKRWVVVAPPGGEGCNLLLAKAKDEQQATYIGNQTGGRVFLFLHTSDFDAYYQHLVDQGVKIIRARSEEEYGIVAVFSDIYGNLWDLIQRN